MVWSRGPEGAPPVEEGRMGDLDFAIQASPTPLLLVDAEGRIVAVNRRASDLFGYAIGELVGAHIEVLIPESVRPYHAELRSAFMELPTSRSMGRGRDLFGVTRGGTPIPIEIGLDPVERNGRVWVLVSVLDIAERVNAERRIRMALDAVSNGVVMVDARGTIVLANAQTSEIFGYPREALIGRPVEMLVPERYRRRHRVFRTSYANVKQARRMGDGQELYGLRADGREIPVEIALTPIESPDGVLIMSTIMDLTERRRHELDTEARNRQLSVLNAELTQFAYSASHDLKAPLNSIDGLLGCAIEDLDDGDVNEVRHNLVRARTLASRLTHRIEDMLAIAGAVDRPEISEPIDLAALVHETWEAMPISGREPSPVLEVTLRHTTPLITTRAMLASILENLISNALKFTDPAQPLCRVQVASRSVDGWCEIAVGDNGIGIPVDHHGEVFDMFKRFSPDHPEGSGLGLALVRKYVEVLGGEIGFVSSPEGTTFTFRLPVRAGAPS